MPLVSEFHVDIDVRQIRVLGDLFPETNSNVQAADKVLQVKAACLPALRCGSFVAPLSRHGNNREVQRQIETGGIMRRRQIEFLTIHHTAPRSEEHTSEL